MKRPAKFLAILSAVSMSVSLLVPTLTASADAASALPFDLEAPTNVAMKYLDGDDSPNTIQIVYSQNNSMSEFFSDKDNNYDQWLAELNAEGYDDMWVTAQIDWSIDSAEDWHYNEYWDTEGYDEDYHMRLGEWAFISCAYSCEQSMSEYIFRFGYDIDDPDDRYWTGSHEGSDDYDGWKDVLEGKYDEVKIDGVNCAKIDLDKHTIYARVRWLVTYDLPDEGGRHTLGSEWSEAAAIGKDAEGSELSTEAAKAAPVIKDLRVTDEEFNDYPIVAFTLDVPEELTAMLAQLELEGGKDPDEIIKRAGVEEFLKYKDAAVELTEYKLLRLKGEHDLSDPFGRATYAKEAAKIIAELPSEMERAIYENYVAKLTGINSSVVKAEIASISAGSTPAESKVLSSGVEATPANVQAARYVLNRTIMGLEKWENYADLMPTEDLRRAADYMNECLLAGKAPDVGTLYHVTSEEEAGAIIDFETARYQGSEEAAFKDCLNLLWKEFTKSRLAELNEKYKMCTTDEERNDVMRLIAETEATYRRYYGK